MIEIDPAVVVVADRAGGYFALVLFASMFALLGAAAWREVRRRAPHSHRGGAVLGVLLFTAPTILVYSSSLSGFYEASPIEGTLVLWYLHPLPTQILLADVADVRPVPAFKGRWRLSITDTQGRQYQSATARRDAVNAAATTLRELLPRLRERRQMP